jgi:hypothetical protein
MARKALLVCGVASALLYVAMNVFVAIEWEGYSSASQTVSELSAIGAPTRQLWVLLSVPYSLLVAAFGWGIWESARRNRSLRVVGGAMVIHGVSGLVWPPMHLREVLAAGGGTLTDTMHIAFTAVTVLLMMVAIGFGAAAFGSRFRIYSLATMATFVPFGVLAGLDAPRIDANLPTPWVGVWERINIGVFLLWIVVLAMALWGVPVTAVPDSSGRRAPAPPAGRLQTPCWRHLTRHRWTCVEFDQNTHKVTKQCARCGAVAFTYSEA